MRSRAEGFGAEAKRRIMLGTYALSAGYYDAYYGQAQKARTLIASEFSSAFERFDVLLTPTSPQVAWKFGEKADPLGHVPGRRLHHSSEPGRQLRHQRALRLLGR